VVLGLAGRGDRRERAAVEGVLRREDERLVDLEDLVRVLACELDGRLVRLGARVAEEGAVRARSLHQPRRELPLLRDVVEVAHVVHRLHLVVDGVSERHVRVAEAAGGDARREVEVLVAVRVPEVAALSASDGKLEAAVGAHHDLVEGGRVERRAGGVS